MTKLNIDSELVRQVKTAMAEHLHKDRITNVDIENEIEKVLQEDWLG